MSIAGSTRASLVSVFYVALCTACDDRVSIQEPDLWISLGVVDRVALNAVDSEVHIVLRHVVKRLAIETLAFLAKILVTLATVGVRERPTHFLRVIESTGQIEKRVFG